MAHNIAICSKVKTRALPTVSGQKMFDIELNMQFYPKNVGQTRVFIFEQMAQKVLLGILAIPYVPFVQK